MIVNPPIKNCYYIDNFLDKDLLKEDSHNGELVGLAMDNNVNFKKLIY